MKFIAIAIGTLCLGLSVVKPIHAAPATDATEAANTKEGRFETPAQLEEFLLKSVGELPDFPIVVPMPVPPALAHTIGDNQPQAGDWLLERATDTQDALHRRALMAWLGSIDSMSAAQITAYLQRALEMEVSLRPHYAEGFDASARFAYTLQHGWGSLPQNFTFKGQVVQLLDGQPYGAPYESNGPMSTTGWLRTDQLALGRHHAAMQMEFNWQWHDLQGEGRADSPDFSFEIVNGTVPDDLEALNTPATQKLVRESFRVEEKPDEEPVFNGPAPPNGQVAVHDPWRPQTTTQDAAGNTISARVPTWKLEQPLPFALAFDVEIHPVGSDQIFAGGRILIPTGQTRGGFFFPDSLREFAEGRDGVVAVKFVLQPSYDLALSEPEIKTFFGGTLTFDDLHIRITRPKR